MSIYFQAAHPANYRARRTQPVQYIVLHYTANRGDTARGNLAYFSREVAAHTSAHYFVDRDEVCQSVPEAAAAQHCGGKTRKHPHCINDNSIGIELCDSVDGVPPETRALALELVRDIMRRYHIPADHVLRHYDVTGKLCPLPWVKDPAAWRQFVHDLEEEPMTYDDFKTFMARYRAELANQAATMPQLLAEAQALGLTDGTRPRDLVTREEAAIMARAAAKQTT